MRDNLDVGSDSIKGIIVSYCVVAGVITVFRLAVRGPSRWWWDDLCAFLGMLAIVLQTTVLWLRIGRFAPLIENHTASIAFFYLNSICFYIEDWGARCAILFSVCRITPGKQLQRFMKLLAFSFFVLFWVNVALIVGTCEAQHGWHDTRSPRCKLANSVPIFRIVTGILSDALLVVLPIYNLRKLRSAPGFRRTLIIIFGSSAWLTAACIVQAAITIQTPGDPELVATMTEGFIALLLCNLSVVAIALMQLCGYDKAFPKNNIVGSVELSNGVQISTLDNGVPIPQDGLGGERRSSDSSFKKDGGSDYSAGRKGFLARWRNIDVDAGDRRPDDTEA